jgi:hypothetical protein
MTLSEDGVRAGLDAAAKAWKHKHAMENHDGNESACEEFEPKEAASDYLGIEIDDVNVILSVTYEMVQGGLPHVLVKALLTKESPVEELVQIGVDMAVATFAIGMRQILDERSRNVANRYTATVLAEAHLSTYKAMEQDLGSIWPEAIVEEVAEQYTAGEAFLVGVLCGRTSG